jgi:hypothetical protein
MTHDTETVIPDNTGGIDSTPSVVFTIGIASILILFGLKYMGFRFSFGVGVGGGG